MVYSEETLSNYTSLLGLLPHRGHIPGPQWLSETVDGTQPYGDHVSTSWFLCGTQDLNCQHHFSYALGPSVGKVRVTEHKHCSLTAHLMLRWLLIDGWAGRFFRADTLDKGGINIRAGQY